MTKGLEIKVLSDRESLLISRLFQAEKPEYLKYFNPFSFDEASVRKVLGAAVNDKMFGLFVEGDLVGIHMLRGWDEGFSIPAFGVFISSKFSGMNLAKVSLMHAISVCKLNKSPRIMLKVDSENLVAKKLYESLGFLQTGIDSKNGNLIYHKQLL